MPARVADVLQVVVLAPGAHAFLRAAGARVVALLQARNVSLNWFIPAFVNSKVESLAGTSEELRTPVARAAKKSRKPV